MLSHSRCLCRTLRRSLSALSQGNNVLAGRTTSGLSTGNRVVYRNTQLCEPPSSIVVFHIRYFKTSTAHRDEVVTVNTPPFSESITEGDVRWEKGFVQDSKTFLWSFPAVGDSVKEDEVVCEIETDKTSLQVPSPAAGVITELLVPDGGRVEAGNPLFKLKKGDAAANAAPAAEVPAAAAPPPTMACRRGSTSQTFFCGQAHCTSTTSSSPWGQDREQGQDESYEAEDRPATEGGSADLCHAHHLQRDRHEQHPGDEEAP